MTDLLHELLLRSAERHPENEAIVSGQRRLNYSALAETASRFAGGLLDAGLSRHDRVAIYLHKRPETIAAIFGTVLAGGVFVPVNPLLKSEQLVHILRDCNVRVLVTTAALAEQLADVLSACEDLDLIVTVDAAAADAGQSAGQERVGWDALLEAGGRPDRNTIIDTDMAGIFYTSGSTGKPKGVVLSHRNMVAGAASVASYLGNHSGDRLLSVLPLGFDYGFSQVSTAFHVGATAVLMDYLFPNDVIKAAEKHGITGLAGVPPLWIQLAKQAWPESVAANLRYITNSGGAMPVQTLATLREHLPETQVFLMYGLTEAFRSTYLDPAEVGSRPESMGKAIPNAEVLVVREDGTRCGPGEPGELIHRGALVAMGYWNDPEKTARRFRPVPQQIAGLVLPEMAVWSGDTVVSDEDGYLYFVGRNDDMIKTSGYRVSPAEVETVVYAAKPVAEAVAIGVPHPELGQGVVVVAVAAAGEPADDEAILAECRQHLPAFMVPARIVWQDSLPRNPNGKLDRKRIREGFLEIFQDTE